jgi:hypothetical protein
MKVFLIILFLIDPASSKTWLEYDIKEKPPRVEGDLLRDENLKFNFLERTIIVSKTNASISRLTLQIDVPHFTQD